MADMVNGKLRYRWFYLFWQRTQQNIRYKLNIFQQFICIQPTNSALNLPPDRTSSTHLCRLSTEVVR